jgi:hypothetical protein
MADNAQVQNKRGEWVPAIPEPLHVGVGLRVKECECGARFRDSDKYRGHYALVHILGLD